MGVGCRYNGSAGAVGIRFVGCCGMGSCVIGFGGIVNFRNMCYGF